MTRNHRDGWEGGCSPHMNVQFSSCCSDSSQQRSDSKKLSCSCRMVRENARIWTIAKNGQLLSFSVVWPEIALLSLLHPQYWKLTVLNTSLETILKQNGESQAHKNRANPTTSIYFRSNWIPRRIYYQATVRKRLSRSRECPESFWQTQVPTPHRSFSIQRIIRTHPSRSHFL